MRTHNQTSQDLLRDRTLRFLIFKSFIKTIQTSNSTRKYSATESVSNTKQSNDWRSEGTIQQWKMYSPQNCIEFIIYHLQMHVWALIKDLMKTTIRILQQSILSVSKFQCELIFLIFLQINSMNEYSPLFLNVAMDSNLLFQMRCNVIRIR